MFLDQAKALRKSETPFGFVLLVREDIEELEEIFLLEPTDQAVRVFRPGPVIQLMSYQFC